MKRLTQMTLQTLKAVLVFLTVETRYHYYEVTEKTFSYSYYRVVRWYSPIFWVVSLFALLIAPFQGGLINWALELIETCKAFPEETTSQSGELVEGASKFRTKFELFVITHI